MKVNVRNMQRVPHRHTFGNGKRINGRDVCDACPYRDPRTISSKPLATVREMYDFEKKMVLESSLPSLTVPELKERILKLNPNATGLGKMRKSELVSTLVGMVK